MDVGIRLRELVFTRTLIVGPARNALAGRIAEASSSPARLVTALGSIDSLLDTWPLAALIDEARQRWSQGPDGWALAVLARAAAVLSPVLGWPSVIDRRWLMPSLDELRRLLGPESRGRGAPPDFEVIARGPADGAPALRVGLGLPQGVPEMWDLPRVLVVQGDELASSIDALCARLEAGEAAAVRFESPVPWDDESRAALARLAEVAPAQAAFERYGHAGLVAPDAPTWDEVLQEAPPGIMSERVAPVGSLLVLPTIDQSGSITQFGAVVWDAGYRPLRLVAAAGAVLQRLDGERTPAQVAALVNLREGLVRSVIEQLVRAGAASAAD